MILAFSSLWFVVLYLIKHAWFSEHEAEADCQQHHGGASVQCLDWRLHPGIAGEENCSCWLQRIVQISSDFQPYLLENMLGFWSLSCFLISRAHSSRCGSQNKSMKKEESSVLKGNVPDLLFFLNIYNSPLFAVQLWLWNSPKQQFFLYIFLKWLSTMHHINCKF